MKNRDALKNRDAFVSIEQLGRDLAKLPGMSMKIDEARAALIAAEFIKTTRKAAHLSQAELAKKVDVTQARISQMEQGESKSGPSLALLAKIAAALGGSLNISFVRH
jgi:DNA-binding XRE family transcriptional regulator